MPRSVSRGKSHTTLYRTDDESSGSEHSHGFFTKSLKSLSSIPAILLHDDDTSEEIVKINKPPKVIAKRYVLGLRVGRGSFSVVKEGVDVKAGHRIAVKIVKMLNAKKVPGGLDAVHQEIRVNHMLHHRNIVHMYDHCVDLERNKMYIMLEYIVGKSLEDLLAVQNAPSLASANNSNSSQPKNHIIDATDSSSYSSSKSYGSISSIVPVLTTPAHKKHYRVLNEELTCRLFIQLLLGLHHIHSRGVVHADIKPSNLMICFDTCTLKIADFGVAQIFTELSADNVGLSSDDMQLSSRNANSKLKDVKRSKVQGTLAFQPPEIVSGKSSIAERGAAVDIWAAGIVLYMMCVGRYPFDGDSLCDLMDNIGNGNLHIPDENLSPDLCDLLGLMLETAPDSRLEDISHILTHQWVQESLGIKYYSTDPDPFVQFSEDFMRRNSKRALELLEDDFDELIEKKIQTIFSETKPGHFMVQDTAAECFVEMCEQERDSTSFDNGVTRVFEDSSVSTYSPLAEKRRKGRKKSHGNDCIIN